MQEDASQPFTSPFSLDGPSCSHVEARPLLREVQRRKLVRQLHSIKLFSQRFNNILPIQMARQALSRIAANAMLTVQAHVQWVVTVTPRRDADPDAIRAGVGMLWCFTRLDLVLRLI